MGKNPGEVTFQQIISNPVMNYPLHLMHSHNQWHLEPPPPPSTTLTEAILLVQCIEQYWSYFISNPNGCYGNQTTFYH